MRTLLQPEKAVQRQWRPTSAPRARRLTIAPGYRITPSRIARVALATPLRRLFDYVVPEGTVASPGARVRVPFGRGARVGVVAELADDTEVPAARLKRLTEVVDEIPLLAPQDLAFVKFAAAYFHHSLGEALMGALPGLLRTGKGLQAAVRLARAGRARARRVAFRLTPQGLALDATALARSPRQRALYRLIGDAASREDGLPASELDTASPGWRAPMTRLVARGLVEECQQAHPRAEPNAHRPVLSGAQRAALEAVWNNRDRFAAHLLDGVTGSGKTEVYLGLVERTLEQGRQALILVPEIALTPQLAGRFAERLGVEIALLHSGLNDSERLLSWTDARSGEASVVLGTRSAVFTPMPSLGLIVVDEEHDASLKQQEGFRYNARDLAVKRASEVGVPVLLGSATPSLESIRNVQLDRYCRLPLPERAGGASAPEPELVDVRGQPFDEGLSVQLMSALRDTLERSEQALLFINRRGYAPVLLCHDCGAVCECRRCDARMVFHEARPENAGGGAAGALAGRLSCHHCGAQRQPPAVCPECGAGEMRALGLGTERVAKAIAQRLPSARVERLDRDNTRRRGALEAMLERVRLREIDILVGTQMLAKGHDFPAVTLVGILDADAGLFGADFRSSERMAQLLVQVSGRAGRGERPGRVLVQTHHPSHPLLLSLVHGGYAAFSETALAERLEAGLPPYACAALLRAEAPTPEPGRRFLMAARELLAPDAAGVRALGPVPAPMERRAGRYRAQLYLEADERSELQGQLSRVLDQVAQLPQARTVRWSIDVDPQDTL